MKTTPARKAARGQPCMVRLEGCDGGGETTILAHYSLAGLSGRGYKSSDAIGAWCCYPCHQKCDGAVKSGYTRDQLRLALAEGVFRTWQAMEDRK
jgi:hypothetical protein